MNTKTKNILIGSHVPMTKNDDYLIGSALKTVEQEANAFMIFTGPPQSTQRTPVNLLNINQMKEILHQNQILTKNLVVHAPYIINLANQFNNKNWQFGVDFFIEEVLRSEAMGINLVVVHPGSTLGGDLKKSLDQVINAINQITNKTKIATIVLETMSGKTNEVGSTLEELAYILKNVNQPNRIGICLDTCHLNDAGYDLTKWDEFKENFDKVIGLDKVKMIHLNDSKNPLGSHCDRHENIGYGKIGFANLINIAWDPTFENIPKILETPLKKTKSAHRFEIKAIKQRTFIDFLKDIN